MKRPGPVYPGLMPRPLLVAQDDLFFSARVEAAARRLGRTAELVSPRLDGSGQAEFDRLRGDVKATIKQAAAQIRTVARPMSLNAYKVDIAQGLVERTVLQALG